MGRAPCCDKANVKKGPWSPEEDAKLKAYIEAKGTGGNWIALPQKIGLKRCGKSCRLRWLNYLRPNIKHGGFTEEEENLICNLYINIGSRWSIIAAQLPGRTDNDIKNYWNTRLKKKLMARQRKEQQAACRLLEQEIKRESETTFLVNQTLNQIPSYWAHPQTSMPMVGPQVYGENQDQNQVISIINGNNNYHHHYPTNNEHFYGGLNDNIEALSNGVNFSQWLNMDFDVNNNNGVTMDNTNMHQGPDQNNLLPLELEAYLCNLLTFNGGNESYSGVDVGSTSSTTSNSPGSSNWGEMNNNSLVNTPGSSFDAYQSGVVMQAL